MKAEGWIKDYHEKSLASGDKSVRVTIEFQDKNADIIKEIAGYAGDKPYMIIIE